MNCSVILDAFEFFWIKGMDLDAYVCPTVLISFTHTNLSPHHICQFMVTCQIRTDMFIIDFSPLRPPFSSVVVLLPLLLLSKQKLEISTPDNHRDPISFVVQLLLLSLHFLRIANTHIAVHRCIWLFINET